MTQTAASIRWYWQMTITRLFDDNKTANLLSHECGVAQSVAGWQCVCEHYGGGRSVHGPQSPLFCAFPLPRCVYTPEEVEGVDHLHQQ